jgi:hypothetical protein
MKASRRPWVQQRLDGSGLRDQALVLGRTRGRVQQVSPLLS